tara:strand:+ start:3808 stop:3963 length:156 start_codon:yes stop_codon:yes gene_type:complete
MNKIIAWHKRQTEKWMGKLNIDWYGVAWIAWAKGVTMGLLIWLFVYLVHLT